MIDLEIEVETTVRNENMPVQVHNEFNPKSKESEGEFHKRAAEYMQNAN
jgi:hypothetical protein